MSRLLDWSSRGDNVAQILVVEMSAWLKDALSASGLKVTCLSPQVCDPAHSKELNHLS